MMTAFIDGDRSSAGRADRTRSQGKTTTRGFVLVVDDDASASSALEKLLRAEGFSTSTAADGDAALAEVGRVLPDVVLTDLHMPRMGGVELCTRLHEIDENLPVIIITGQPDLQCVIESLREGADDFLTKPVESDALAEELGETFVRNALTGHDGIAEDRDDVVDEERGGPFVRSSGRVEYALGTDLSNPRDALREPFPKT